MRIDLHTHTRFSDGTLTPFELLQRAEQQGVEVLAITDHDTVAGYLEVSGSDRKSNNIKLLSGIEFSCLWNNRLIHVLGLNIDVTHAGLQEGIEQQTQARDKRAVVIAERLERAGFKGVLTGAKERANNSQIGRPHFAQYLVESGQIKSIDQAFKRVLGTGKIGDVKAHWPSLETVLSWIINASGTAVIAHPLQYKLTRSKLVALCDAFIAGGGQAIELISGIQQRRDTELLHKIALQKDMMISVGSDFHGPGLRGRELGRYSDYEFKCLPVWHAWS